MKSMKDCREKAGLTQERLAEAVGLSQETISQYENGTRVPNVIVGQKKIASVLNEPLDNIFFEKNIS